MKNQNGFHLNEPRISQAVSVATPDEAIHDDAVFSRCIIEKNVFTGEARHVNMSQVVFHGARFVAALPATEMEDVLFDACDLSNVDLSDAILERVCFTNCRMTGIRLSGASLRDTAFNGCVLKYADFRFSRLRKTVFQQCDCSHGDFHEAELPHSGLHFIQTDLCQAQMSGVPLADLDLTTCDINGLGARPEDLRGAVLSPEQAVTVAKIVGVIIKQ